MKRDMDLIRGILLGIEEDIAFMSPQFNQKVGGRDIRNDQGDAWDFWYHLSILVDGGMITARYAKEKDSEVFDEGRNIKLIWSNNFYYDVTPIGLTWRGHEFLDDIRDPEIWRETKEGAKKLGSFSLELLGALAKGLIKKKIEEHTGIKI